MLKFWSLDQIEPPAGWGALSVEGDGTPKDKEETKSDMADGIWRLQPRNAQRILFKPPIARLPLT